MHDNHYTDESIDTPSRSALPPDARSIISPALMRLEERIVLEAGGVADNPSDADSPDDGSGRVADDLPESETAAGTTNGTERDGAGNEAPGSARRKENPQGSHGFKISLSRKSRSSIGKATQLPGRCS